MMLNVDADPDDDDVDDRVEINAMTMMAMMAP